MSTALLPLFVFAGTSAAVMTAVVFLAHRFIPTSTNDAGDDISPNDSSTGSPTAAPAVQPAHVVLPPRRLVAAVQWVMLQLTIVFLMLWSLAAGNGSITADVLRPGGLLLGVIVVSVLYVRGRRTLLHHAPPRRP